MRITFVAGRYWPATGGAETLVHHVATALAERHEVTVVADRVDERPDERLGESLRHPAAFAPFHDGRVRVVPVNLRMRHRAALVPLAAQVVPGLARYAYGRPRVPMMALYAAVVGPLLSRHVRYADLVHVWTAGFLGAAAVRAARVAGVPAVMTPFIHPGQWGDDLASRRLLCQVDRVVGLLEVERAIFSGLGVRPDRIATCGVCSPPVPTGGGDELRRRYVIEGPLVLFLGVRRAYKGHDLLLAVADRVAARTPVTFAFVGPGPRLASDGLAARVLDVGRVGEAERGAWLDAADLLCLPSKHEIFPVSVLEAWSAKTPVLVSDLPPLVELIARSQGGRTVAPEPAALAAALVDFLACPGERRRCGRHGYEFWRARHTPAAIAACHEKLYEVLVPAFGAK
jgi:phosphatidylinositol alpha-1,6-mannosyltransferase